MPIQKVTDPALLQQLGSPGQIVAPNPMFPGQLQGQALNNQGQSLTNARTSAELPFVAPKAAADAQRSQLEAGIAAQTAPAEVASKNAGARKAAIDATTAERNFEATGGASDTQAKSASFYTRAQNSNKLYEGTGINDDPISREALKALLPDALVNKYTSPARQQAEAAQKDFIAATLRYESGANLPPSEFATQREIFFPAPGDDPSTVRLKAQLRKNAIEGLRLASGPAAPKLDANAPQPPAETAPVVQPEQTVGGGFGAQGATVSQFDPQLSGAIDRLIRLGRPPEEIRAFVQQQGGTPPTNLDAAILYARQHPEYKGGFAQATRTRPTTLGEKIAGSALGAGLSAAGTAATFGLNDEAAGLASLLQGGDYAQGRDAFNAKKQLLASEHPLADLAGTVGGSIATMGALNAGAAGKLANALKPAERYGLSAEQAAAAGASRAGLATDIGYGAGYGAGENNQDRAGGAILGGAAAGAGNLAGRGIANTLGAAVSPTGGKLRPLYDIGVRPSVGQRFGGLVNNIEEKLQSIPFMGDAIEGTRQNARDQFQVGLFNDALGEIGEQLPKGMKPGHDPHAFAQKAFNSAYNTAKSSMTAAADNGLATDLGALQKSVSMLKPDSQKAFDKVWADSVGRRFSDGSLSGPAFKDATSEIEKRIAAIRNNKTGDGEMADALQQAVDALKASAMRNSPPEAVAAMEAADRGYAKLVQIEDASKRAGGDAATFTPKQFEAAVKNTSTGVRKRGYLAGKALNSDLAEAGLNLSDVVSNSGTVDRMAAPLALVGTGFVAPKAAAGLGAFGLMNAPGVRNILTGILAPRNSAKARKTADAIRALMGPAGTTGSALGIGFLGPR